MKRTSVRLGAFVLVVFAAGCEYQVAPTGPSAVDSPVSAAPVREPDANSNEVLRQLGPPFVARNDVFFARQGESLTVSAPGVLRNDSVPRGVSATVEFIISTLPSTHRFTNTNDGGFIFDLSVTPELSGKLSFDYRLHAGAVDSNVATVTLQITP